MRSWQCLSRWPGELSRLFVNCRPLATLAARILVTHTMRSVNGSTAVWKSLDKCCLFYLTLCDLFAVARSHASWPRWMDMCWMYSVKFFLASSFLNRIFYCFPCLGLYVSFLFIIIIYLLCVMLVYSIYCIVVSLLLFSPPERWTFSCKYFLSPCVD